MKIDGRGDLASLFAEQGRVRWEIASSSLDERLEKLRRLKRALVEGETRAAAAVGADFSKSPDETWLTEIFPVVEEINHALGHLGSWMRDRPARSVFFMPGARSRLVHEPKGRILILSPWNYPVQLALAPLVSAIAAGNLAIIKPSNKTPATAAFLADLIEGIFPRSEVAVVEGPGALVGDLLLELPFDHIFFTGSPTIGARVGAAAARLHAGVTLELGGKSPVILLRGADIKDAARKIMWGKNLNAGQTCLAPDYLLCPRELTGQFAMEAQRAVEKMYGPTEEARRASPDLPRIVDSRACEGHRSLVENAIALGATLAFGGVFDLGERYAAPTLLIDVPTESEIMREEIFGPILPLIPYDDLAQALDFVRSRPKPLALYVFGRDRRVIRSILAKTSSGSACVNDLIVQIENPDLPFGGVGMSGMGNYHGVYGFRTFSHERNVMRQGRPNLLGLFYPPYGGVLQRSLRRFLGRLTGSGGYSRPAKR